MQQIHIMPVSTMWEVRSPTRGPSTWATEWDALRYARYIAERDGGAEIVVFGDEGIISTEVIDP